MNDFETPKKKLTLDKIVIPKNIPAPKESRDQKLVESNIAKETVHKKTTRYIVAFTICLAIIVGAMVIIFFLWKTGLFKPSFLTKEKVHKPWETYVNIGPIHTTVGKAGDVRMTVNINCKSPGLQEIVKKNSSAIKAHLLLSLNSPGVDQMVIKKDYKALKANIRDEINSVLNGDYVDEVYFSDFLIY